MAVGGEVYVGAPNLKLFSLESFISVLRRMVEPVGVDLSNPFHFPVHPIVVCVAYYPVLPALNINLGLTLIYYT